VAVVVTADPVIVEIAATEIEYIVPFVRPV
jgi:hypothetical protein